MENNAESNKLLSTGEQIDIDFLLRRMDTGIVLMLADGQIVFANRAAERITGLTHDQILGRSSKDPSWKSLNKKGVPITPEEHPGMTAIRERREVKNQVLGIFNPKTNDISWLNVQAIPIFREGEEHPYMVCDIFWDITEKERAEQELRNARQRMEMIVALSPAMIYSCQFTGTFQSNFVSDDVRTQLGYAPEQFYEDPDFWARKIHPDDYGPLLEKLEVDLKRGYARNVYRAQRSDGTYRWMRDFFDVIKDEAGEPVEIFGFWADITAEVEAEEERRRYTERLETLHEIDKAVLMQHSPREIARTALERLGKLIPYTRASVSLFDWDEGLAEVLVSLGEAPPELQTGSQVRLWMTNGKRRVEKENGFVISDISKEPVVAGRKSLLELGGYLSMANVPLHTQGRLIGAIGLFSDKTNSFSKDDLKIMQEVGDSLAVMVYQSKLLSRLQAKKTQLQNLSSRILDVQENERRAVAHELHDEVGQYLTGLRMTLESMQELPPEKSLAKVETANELIRELIRRVREMSLSLRPGMLDDLGLIPALLWHFENYKNSTDIDVDFQHEGLESKRFASTLETTVYRIVQEALTNVARHSESRKVSVRVSANQKTLSLTVEDEGVGFDPDVAGRRDSIGLSGMKERAELIGGLLTINSTSGSGTCIFAELPIKEEL